ncbi:MAG TPA: DUF2442 domain-containing protein [Tepidiformaceae bacterium]|nr:DUF2442 domain-containing protein [Tepidiformaceae bacterium]
MTISVAEPLATRVWCDESRLWVELADGRILGVPLQHFPRLLKGTPNARSNWELIGRGDGIHWPELDEDISVAGLLAGARDNTRRGREHGSGSQP